MSAEFSVWVVAGVACGAAAVARLAANALLRMFAAQEPELWHQAGEPSGLFAPPRGRSSLFTLDPVMQWLTQTPAWVGRYSRARQLLLIARIASALMVLAIFALLFFRLIA